MRQQGKKSKEWIRARKSLIKDALLAGRIVVRDGAIYGKCEDCQEWKALTPDHRKKRSQGGGHEAGNIDWVCIHCHNLRDNMGDPKNKKTKYAKPDWTRPHECKNCKETTSFLVCTWCNKMSI